MASWAGRTSGWSRAWRRTTNSIIRKGASTKDAIVKSVPNGTILRNKGCKMVDGAALVRVERPVRCLPSPAGLRADSCARRERRRRRMPRRCAGARHQLPCHGPHSLHARRSARCEGLRIRRHARAPGVATVFITVPNGFVRVLTFDNGKVAPQSAVTELQQPPRSGQHARQGQRTG